MRLLLTNLCAAMLLGAFIGEAAGWIAGGFRLDGEVGGAVIGAVIGVYFAARASMHRHTPRRDE